MKIILIILLIYFALMFFGKYIFPWILRAYIKKITKSFGSGLHHQSPFEHYKKEGEVSVDTSSQKKKKIQSDDSEYVDYEEIK